MKKILCIVGTRPDVIKLASVIKLLKKKSQVCIVFTGQHLQLANQAMTDLKIQPDYALGIMNDNQTLSQLASRLHENLTHVLENEKPDIVVVQGDTATAVIGAQEAYYHRIPVAHVEAGLRTGNIYNPFPEEVNRKIISQIASYNFAPTEKAKLNLLKENVFGKIEVTGNTGIDTLLEVAKKIQVQIKKQVLVTLHRRESFGKPLKEILRGISLFLQVCPEWNIVFPVHLNPNVREIVYSIWGKHPQVRLLPPLNYLKMVELMKSSSFIITDSGGIQEEAPSLNKPVLVAREDTERPEGIDLGVAMMVGTNEYVIAQAAIELVKNKSAYEAMINKKNPYGDGKASEKIVNYLLKI